MGRYAELLVLDALGQAELVRRKEVTPRELVEAALARIDKANPALNAVVLRLDDRAREAARKLSSRMRQSASEICESPS